MSDTAQGPGWWQSPEGTWYPPESHPEYRTAAQWMAERPTTPGGVAIDVRTAPVAPVRVAAEPTTAPFGSASTVAAPPPEDAWPDATATWGRGAPPERSGTGAGNPFSPVRLVGLGALAIALVGVFLAWAKTSVAVFGVHVSDSVQGIHLGEGRILGGVLVAAACVSWWHLGARGRTSGGLLALLWLGALSIGIYEVAHIITVPTHGLLSLEVGGGLYLCVFAASIGTLCALFDLAQVWDRRAQAFPTPATSATPATPAGVLWLGGVVAVGAVSAASFIGSQATGSPVGPIPTVAPAHPAPSGASNPGGPGGSGTTGGTGAFGSSGTGNTGPADNGFGNSGSGDSGLGNSGLGNSGSGNSGVGDSGLGNSGLGSSGSGDPGSGGLFPGIFGTTGSGNSGPGNGGTGDSGNSGDGFGG